MADFETPELETIPASSRYVKNRDRATFYPAEGNKFTTVYFEATPANAAAANALIAQARELCVTSLQQNGTSEPVVDRRYSVTVQVTRFPNAQLE